MHKFASLFAITLCCVCQSAFAQETENETVSNSEVATSGDNGDSGASGDVAPHRSDAPTDCGCGKGKPKN